MSTRRSFLKRLTLAIPMAALATELSFSNVVEEVKPDRQVILLNGWMDYDVFKVQKDFYDKEDKELLQRIFYQD